MDFGILDEVKVEEAYVRFVQIDPEVTAVKYLDVFNPLLHVCREHQGRRITQ